MMTKIIIVVSIFICVFVTVQAAAVSPQDCGERMQSQLRELLATKQTCDAAFFKDCCQMVQFFPNGSLLTGVFELRVFRAPPLTPFSPPPTYIAARCDMETDGGGWMVIQRRVTNGTVNFTRDWDDYVSGFGDLDGEFWYGLDNIHYLTTGDDVELRIDMVMEDNGSELTWTYQTFTVAGPEDMYRLTIGGGVGTGADAMAYHNGQQFSTYGNDNDQSGSNCAYLSQGGWWYNNCYRANLNGPHDTPSTPGVSLAFARLIWYDGSSFIDFSSSEMKIRVKGCVMPPTDSC